MIHYEISEEEIQFNIDESVYPLNTVLRTSYALIDRFYIYLEKKDHVFIIHITPKPMEDENGAFEWNAENAYRVVGEYCNELLQQQIRRTVTAETTEIRKLVTARALYSASLPSEPEKELRQSSSIGDTKTPDRAGDFCLDGIVKDWFEDREDRCGTDI